MFYIKNKGHIDLAALMLIGATSKADDESKIGFFGSGNKYALATMLRRKIGVRIFSGEREIVIGTKPVDFRGVAYDQITIDGADTSFTTRLGPQWETWMGLREFICNAVDEGEHDYGEMDPCGEDGYTMIFIDKTPETRKFFLSMDEFLAFDREAIEEIEVKSSSGYGDPMKVRVLEKQEQNTSPTIYRKGVKCDDGRFRDSVFDYDLSKLAINESRIMDSSWEAQYAIVQALSKLVNEESVTKIIKALQDPNTFEAGLSWTNVASYSETWRRVIGRTTMIQDDLAKFAPGDVSEGALVLPSALVVGLKKQFSELNAFGVNTMEGVVESGELASYEKLSAAVESVLRWFPKSKTLTFQPCQFAADGALSAKQNNTVYLNTELEHRDASEIEVLIFEQCALHESNTGFGTRVYESYLAALCIRVLKSGEEA